MWRKCLRSWGGRLRRRRFPTPQQQRRPSWLSPRWSWEVSVCPGRLWGPQPVLPGGQTLRECTLLGGKSLRPTPNFAKIPPLSEPSLKLPTLGLQSLGRSRDGQGASLSRLLASPPHLRSKPAWRSNGEAGKQRPSRSTRARALSWTEDGRGAVGFPAPL